MYPDTAMMELVYGKKRVAAGSGLPADLSDEAFVEKWSARFRQAGRSL